MVKRADLQHRSCQFDSYMCHIKNFISEEGDGKTPRNLVHHKKIITQTLLSLLEIEYTTWLFSGNQYLHDKARSMSEIKTNETTNTKKEEFNFLPTEKKVENFWVTF